MHIWQWHPIFVHFTAGLLATSLIVFLAGFAAKEKPWAGHCFIAARWMFGSGIVAILFTAVTGLLAYFTVPHPAELQGVINWHVIAAILTAVAYFFLAFWLWKKRALPLSGNWLTGLVLASFLLVCTGFLGGKLVFDYGVGVNAVSENGVPRGFHG
jgi:uncharacterized membrane protein